MPDDLLTVRHSDVWFVRGDNTGYFNNLEGTFEMKKLIALLVLVCAGLPAVAEHHGGGHARQYFEIRTYSFSNAGQHEVVEDYWEKAAIPAMERLGIGPIGVFTEFDAEKDLELPRLVVVIPYSSIEQFVSISDQLIEDAEYLELGAPYLNAAADSPAYSRIESTLLHAFEAVPQVRGTDTEKERIFELREYEGRSEQTAHIKVRMFEEVEVEVFDQVGFTSVFFGTTLAGQNRPSLIYMLTFDDLEDKAHDWRAFLESDEWAEASSKEKWADAEPSHISSVMLHPTSFSQL